MKGLTEVLAEHAYQGINYFANMGEGGVPMLGLCTCGWSFEVVDDADDIALWSAHVAAAVLDWVRERLAVAREDVADVSGVGSLCSHSGPVVNDGCEDCRALADAALAAVAEALGVGEVRG